MAADEIKVTFDMDDIEGKSQDEKLTLLLKIAFANYAALSKHGAILFGNGESGLCDVVRESKKGLKLIFWIVFSSIAGFAGAIVAHLSGK